MTFSRRFKSTTAIAFALFSLVFATFAAGVGATSSPSATTKPPSTTKPPATTIPCFIPNAICLPPGSGNGTFVGEPNPWYKESAGAGPCVNGTNSIINDRAISTVVNLKPGTFTTINGVVLTNYGVIPIRTDGATEIEVGKADLSTPIGGTISYYYEARAYKSVRTIKRCINGGFQHWYYGNGLTTTCRFATHSAGAGLKGPLISQRFIEGPCPRSGIIAP